MTYKGAIDEVKSLANNSLMPVIFKPSLKKIAETLEMERPTATLDEIKAEFDREYEELDGYDPSSLGTFAEKVDDILDKYKAEDRPKGEWEIFGFPTSDDILYCQEEFICSECRDFKVNRYMRATYNFCPNCGADMRGKAE